MVSPTGKRRRLREIIAASELGVFPGVFDGYSVRLVQRKGFQGGLISGAGLANSRLARPDVGIMGLEANLAACRALCPAAVDIPLTADGDGLDEANALDARYAPEGI